MWDAHLVYVILVPIVCVKWSLALLTYDCFKFHTTTTDNNNNNNVGKIIPILYIFLAICYYILNMSIVYLIQD